MEISGEYGVEIVLNKINAIDRTVRGTSIVGM
jgi:hypothetical protein